MTRKTALKQIIFCLILILLFDYLIYIEFYERSSNVNSGAIIFEMLGVFIVPLASLVLGVALSRLIISKTIDFNIFTLSKKESYLDLKQKIGRPKIVLINVTYLFVFFLLVTLSSIIIFKSADRYKTNQLNENGVYQTVIVKEKHNIKGAFVTFDVNDNGNIFTGQIPTDQVGGLNVGDTIKIRFSTKDHNIIDGPYY